MVGEVMVQAGGKPVILDCTLRDGSYAIDYQFTAEDTRNIVRSLEQSGVRYIEIGHGLGLNASQSGKGVAASSDRDYLSAAAESIQKSKFGMFFIPGIGRSDDLKIAADFGMDFVRIGTNATEACNGEPYIREAKDLGFQVFSNLMKSYVLTPPELSDVCKQLERFGTDAVYIVDSSGGMLPSDVQTYVSEIKEAGISLEIGFHGHNNLSLAIANSITAIEAGATYIDTCLGGIGRSAGNAQTEVLVTVLKKMGIDPGIDEFMVMDLSERIISPLIEKKNRIDSIAITSGYADFHSGFLDTICKYSEKYSIDSRRLIIEVCKRNKVDLPEELAEQLSYQIFCERSAQSDISVFNICSLETSRKEWRNSENNRERAGIVRKKMSEFSKKTGKQTVFTINISNKPDGFNMVFPSLYQSSSYILGSSEMADREEICNVVREIDGIDFILVDIDKKRGSLFDIYRSVREIAKNSIVLQYGDDSVWISAIVNFITQFFDLYSMRVGISGYNELSKKLAVVLSERGAKVSVHADECRRDKIARLNEFKLATSPYPITYEEDLLGIAKGADVLIGFDETIKFDKNAVQLMKSHGLLIDAIIGSIETDAISLAKSLGIFVWRTDMRAAMAGEVTTVLRSHLLKKHTGKTIFQGMPAVAGGYIGDKGDIIVDSILEPNNIFGIADGKGNVTYK